MQVGRDPFARGEYGAIGAGRYAVGFLGEMEEDIDRYMKPDGWEWIEVEEEFYDIAYCPVDEI